MSGFTLEEGVSMYLFIPFLVLALDFGLMLVGVGYLLGPGV